MTFCYMENANAITLNGRIYKAIVCAIPIMLYGESMYSKGRSNDLCFKMIHMQNKHQKEKAPRIGNIAIFDRKLKDF